MATAGCKTKSELSIVTVNVKNYNANKLYLEQLLNNFDIICIQEHWLFSFEKDILKQASMRHTCFARSVDDDDLISPYQRPRGYGGIAVFIPLQWAAITKNTMDGDHRLSVTTIDLPNLKLCVVNCYLPCRGYRTSYSDYNDCLTQLREIFIKFSPSYEIVLVTWMLQLWRKALTHMTRYWTTSVRTCVLSYPLDLTVAQHFATLMEERQGSTSLWCIIPTCILYQKLNMRKMTLHIWVLQII